MESSLPVASQRPSGEKLADPTDPAPFATKRARDLRSAKSHNTTVLSVELVAMIFPSAENAIALITPRCSTGKGEAVPVSKSQTSGSIDAPPPDMSDLTFGANASA